MKIESSNTSGLEFERVQNTNNKNKFNPEVEKETIKKAQTDKLEISEESKKMLAIQSRIKEGYYNNPSVVKEVSERINQLI